MKEPGSSPIPPRGESSRIAPASEATNGRGVDTTPQQPSVAHLLKELGDESRLLVRQELALAKAEMSEKLSHAVRDLIAVGAGGLVLVVAAFLFFTALTTGFVSLLELAMSHDVAVWLAPLLMAIALAIVGFAMVKKGTNDLKEASLVPDKTVNSLKQDKQWIKEHTS